jgi:DNA-binding transcriptional ArsR family regulator
MQISISDDLSPVFGALANEHRREIIHALALQPQSISQLASLRGLSLPAIHKHIRVLENAAKVRRRKIGRTNFLALERAPLRRLATWVEQFHPWWGTEGESLETYGAYLGKEPEMTEESS